MQEIRYAKVNSREIPVLISDEREALLAAKAARRAIIGLQKKESTGNSGLFMLPAPYVIEETDILDDEFLERVARRHLGLPWKICETRRLLIREIHGEDFDEIWLNQVGHGFESVEALEAYTKHQYIFYEFGFWALAEKESGDLVGVAGLTIPRDEDMELAGQNGRQNEKGIPKEWKRKQESGLNTYILTWPEGKETLELGYHIFLPYRKRGYATEACRAIISYAREYLNPKNIIARIAKENTVSVSVAAALRMKKVTGRDLL